jgi:competence protein ComEC
MQASATKETATETPVPTKTATETPVPTATSEKKDLTVSYIDVGQGDSILIQSPDGKSALIDGGEAGSGALQYLQSKNVTHLDLMVATHPHSDHIGGLVEVLKTIPTDRVVTNGQPHTTNVYENFLDAIAAAKAEYIEVKRGDTIPLGTLVFQVLSPVSATSGDLNNNSVVLRLEYGNTSFLFTGDAQTNAESGMIASGLPLKAEILKAGHHGSSTSSSPAFLAQVQPAVAVYSAGIGNSYGHPHAETIAALTAIGAKIYGTDANGTITVTTDGGKYLVNAEQAGPRAPPVIIQATQTPVIIQATQTPASANPTLEIASVTSPIAPGSRATLNAKTLPGAACSITVYYKSGPSKAQGLGPVTADASGNCSWSWNVGSNTTPGNWRIVVKANVNGQNLSQETTFVVQR